MTTRERTLFATAAWLGSLLALVSANDILPHSGELLAYAMIFPFAVSGCYLVDATSKIKVFSFRGLIR